MCVKVTEFHLKVYYFILKLDSYTIHQLIYPKTTRPDWTWQMRNGQMILYNSSTVF